MDEVQEVEGWEKWVHMMHELKKAKLIISGSNTKLLRREDEGLEDIKGKKIMYVPLWRWLLG